MNSIKNERKKIYCLIKNINPKEKTLVLIDPSYEIKDDFEKVVKTLKMLRLIIILKSE